MDEVKNDRGYVIISLKQLREICMQFHEVSIRRPRDDDLLTPDGAVVQGVFSQNIPRAPGPQNRIGVIDILEKKYEVTRVVTENLCQYMASARQHKEGE